MDNLKLWLYVLVIANVSLVNSLSASAIGCIEGNCSNGKGKYTWTNGDVYEGDWLKGYRTGKGKYTWTNGNVYEGDWLKGYRTGKGKFTWTNGDVYEGDWLEGERTGKGKFTWPDGDVYEGDFLEGYRTGKGKYTWTNGDVYEGNWLRNDRTGIAKFTWASGASSEKYFLRGEEITESEWKAHLRAEEKKEIARIAQAEAREKAYEKRQRIYNSCYIDKSKGLNLEEYSVIRSLEKTCTSISENPSWLESMKYD